MKKILQILILCSLGASAYAEPVGYLNSKITQANIHKTVCIPNYTDTIRPPVSYTNKLKSKQIITLGLKGSMKAYEEDHFYPLSLGGSPTDPRNLWPQSWTGTDNAKDKDVIETALHRLLCNDQISLKKAQACVKEWRTCQTIIDAIKAAK